MGKALLYVFSNFFGKLEIEVYADTEHAVGT